MNTLTEQELQSFYSIINFRQIQPNENKLSYLKQATELFQEHIPFQNVFLLMITPSQRKPLSFDEIKNQVLSGEGGFCQVQNVFFNSFLLSIGYDVDLISSSYAHIPDNHSVSIVKNVLTQGDRYIIDVGSGFFQPVIELNFEDKSPIYQFQYASGYFQWDEKKEIITKYHINKSGESEHMYTFNLTPIQDFEGISIQNHIYTDPNITPFHNILRIMRFPKTGSLCVVDQTFLKENQENRLKPEIPKFSNTEEFLECVEKHFPKININKCRKAYEHLYFNNK